MSLFLKEISAHPQWQAIIKGAKAMRPEVPKWDSNKDNTDEWKRQSAMQEGFDLCLQIFTKID